MKNKFNKQIDYMGKSIEQGLQSFLPHKNKIELKKLRLKNFVILSIKYFSHFIVTSFIDFGNRV